MDVRIGHQRDQTRSFAEAADQIVRIEDGLRLPRWAPRPAERAHGYDMVMRGGTVTVEHDTPTGALPRRLLRGPQ